MKKLFTFLLRIAVVAILATQACNKDKDEIIQPNQPPVAFAGNDTTFLITNCEPRVALRLDGHKSYDPNVSNALRFLWKQVSGPAGAFVGVDTTRSVAYVYNLVSGEYMFELEVIDIYKNPETASEQHIVFSPSLIKQLPLPKKTLIGTLSDSEKVVKALGITFKK